MPKSWYAPTKPHKFCPGCGHGIALKALGEAIDELNIQNRTVFGCDIGCSLLAWNFFAVDSTQTHHGRTTPVMVGIKRSRPDLLCVGYMGDGGGYSIGSQHLLNSAIRDEKVTLILINNTNYAMTGGQLAPTTLPGQKTETTPYGRDVTKTGYPTKGPEMLAAITADGAYIARATVAKYRQLRTFMKRALQNQMEGNGFSFLEVLSTCPTNWRTNAAQTWDFLEDQMEAYFPVGELKSPFGKGEK
ncbi:MAG: thiamine pyrophosphate-dependent enzyme [Syntrophomonadaceae bacterium]|jgi:2-oxoglutarate ferredoxin oxidoreductase subunit beta|nr:thiamine pyrophosphate-dependent enzyme [Syntrophomonadaceae bacterium]MDH7497529.1 thiamine pyrophosphate-dependent enzyme [Syntrophomonadaceae bacterium]